jgi:hypothetical protein
VGFVCGNGANTEDQQIVTINGTCPAINNAQIDSSFIRIESFSRVDTLAQFYSSGILSKVETKCNSHWTKHHIFWIESKIEESKGALNTNLILLYQQMQWLMHTLSEYDKAANELAACGKHDKKVRSFLLALLRVAGSVV